MSILIKYDFIRISICMYVTNVILFVDLGLILDTVSSRAENESNFVSCLVYQLSLWREYSCKMSNAGNLFQYFVKSCIIPCMRSPEWIHQWLQFHELILI